MSESTQKVGRGVIPTKREVAPCSIYTKAELLAMKQRMDKVRAERVEEQKKRDEEEARRDAWFAKFDALKTNPPVTTIITPKRSYSVKLQEHPNRPGVLSAWALLQVVGVYPDDSEPYRDLAFGGHRGLKLFFGPRSREHITEEYAEDVEYVLNASVIYSRHIEADETPELTINLSLPLMIVGYSVTGKSATVELVR